MSLLRAFRKSPQEKATKHLAAGINELVTAGNLIRMSGDEKWANATDALASAAFRILEHTVKSAIVQIDSELKNDARDKE